MKKIITAVALVAASLSAQRKHNLKAFILAEEAISLL
jgi:hypothetical protein